MRYLFFFVHPSKFHVFRNTINELTRKGHEVEVLITSKDVLEDLVKQEGWNYTNIFPEGRKIKGLPTYIGAAYNLFRTIIRLLKYTRGKKYDLFITDDLLTIVGWLRKTPSILFQDSDLHVVPESAVLMKFAKHILTPESSDMGKFNSKKIGYWGYKELAYLHPNQFTPDKSILKDINSERYFVLRLVNLGATHDVGKKGIDNKKLDKIIALLSKHGQILISSERKLEPKYESYILKLEKASDLIHYIYYADLFIGDSQTTTSEAAIVGTPSIRYNDFVGKLSVMEEKQTTYKLSFGFKTSQFNEMYAKIEELINEENLKVKFINERDRMLKDKIDLTAFLIQFFEEYPESFQKYMNEPDYQDSFK